MKILETKPNSLFGREAPNSVVIECDCEEHFLWEKSRGNDVTCPRKSCGKTETLELS